MRGGRNLSHRRNYAGVSGSKSVWTRRAGPTAGTQPRVSEPGPPTWRQVVMAEDGFRGPQVCSIVGITYRQLDYWARTDLLRPSISEARGSGTQRRYSYRDLLELKVIKQLLDAGVSLQSTAGPSSASGRTWARTSPRRTWSSVGRTRCSPTRVRRSSTC